MNLTIKDILSVPHVGLHGDFHRLDFQIKGISTDSRTVKSGDIFVAIRGEKFDGHDFINEVYAKKAICAIVDNRWKGVAPLPIIIVQDTVKTLGELARVYRRKYGIPIVAITGSNGKTTTKDMLTAILRSRYNVLSTEGNLNNHIGVPLTLFQLKSQHDIAVIEMGMNHKGEIANLSSIAEPTHGLITNVGKAHLGFFGSIEKVGLAKAELFDWLGRDDSRIGFVNLDDPLVVKHAKKLKNKITYGIKSNTADVRCSNVVIDEKGRAGFSISQKRRKSILNVKLSIPGIINVQNALAASTVGFEFGIPAYEVKRALENFKSPQWRMEIQKIGSITIVNDSYNANPTSMRYALETINNMRCKGKRIAVLGDMLELGKLSVSEHKRLGEEICNTRISFLLTYGRESIFISRSAEVPYKKHFTDKNSLIEDLLNIVNPGDIVLIKGSRSMKLDEVVVRFIQKLRLSTKVHK